MTREFSQIEEVVAGDSIVFEHPFYSKNLNIIMDAVRTVCENKWLHQNEIIMYQGKVTLLFKQLGEPRPRLKLCEMPMHQTDNLCGQKHSYSVTDSTDIDPTDFYQPNPHSA